MKIMKTTSKKDSNDGANAVSRISSLVMLNAMMFQEILANHDRRVFSIQKTLDRENLLGAFSDQWRVILNINYYPIFQLARQLIISLTAKAEIIETLRLLAITAQRIISMKAALGHDLIGRVYHKLLADKKYLATYYTRIPSAILLLKLCLDKEAFKIQWHDLSELADVRVADLACGTGTLLMAAAETISHNYMGASAAKGIKPDFEKIHRILMEQIIYGYDVLPSAIHLTASTLALRSPQITFKKMNLFSLPFGGEEARLGSLEFLKANDLKTKDLFGAQVETRQVTGGGELELSEVGIPDLDLCVMNPPFTRSVIGNLLFGSFPEGERKEMQSSLKKVVKSGDLDASITAGLGALFVVLGDRYLKPGGRLALVIPKAIISGVSWEPTRELLRKKYRLEYLVSSHDPLRWNFSESTSLSEVLLVARKINNSEHTQGPMLSINLWRNPATPFDALAINQALRNTPVPEEFPQGQGAMELFLGKEKLGEALAFDWEVIKEWPMWMLPGAFAQSDLIRAAYHLMQGKLWLPGGGVQGHIPLRPLKDFASLGPDGRDIHDGFRLSEALTAYAAFWGHESESIYTMEQKPNIHLSPLPVAKISRPLRRVEDLWPLAGKILLGARVWLYTRRLWAVRLSEPVLSNVWWPVSLKEKYKADIYEKALVLWFNSTIASLMLLANRQETRGAWVQFKKPVLAALPVLDLNRISLEQLEILAAAYDGLGEQGLKTFPEMDVDEVRARIDAAISQALGLPDFSIFRRLLAQEPVVCLTHLRQL
ncbi:MAG: hypothetical protein FJ121_12975 [Deltaproteobacteria bacterium]|nr:hypothetical protein [Deltaproteobacteria bacterium]